MGFLSNDWNIRRVCPMTARSLHEINEDLNGVTARIMAMLEGLAE